MFDLFDGSPDTPFVRRFTRVGIAHFRERDLRFREPTRGVGLCPGADVNNP